MKRSIKRRKILKLTTIKIYLEHGKLPPVISDVKLKNKNKIFQCYHANSKNNSSLNCKLFSSFLILRTLLKIIV